MKKGTYFVMYQGKWQPDQNSKVVCGVFCDKNHEIIAIDNSSFGNDRFQTFLTNLNTNPNHEFDRLDEENKDYV